MIWNKILNALKIAWNFVISIPARIKDLIPKEVRRNDPKIDRAFFIFTICFTVILCILMTFIASWSLYAIQTEEEVITMAGMMKYMKKNANFMVSYIFCGLVLWGTIGFVLSKVMLKVARYFLNYR